MFIRADLFASRQTFFKPPIHAPPSPWALSVQRGVVEVVDCRNAVAVDCREL